jgi:predicted DNA-binding transcriptional regulator AlpA
MSFRHAEKIAALALGKNPTVVNRASCGRNASQFSIAREYLAILEIVERAHLAGQLPSPCKPGFALVWMDRNVIGYPEGLRHIVAAIGHEIADWKLSSEAHAERVASLEEYLAVMRNHHAESASEGQCAIDELEALLDKFADALGEQDEMLKLQAQKVSELKAEREVLQQQIADQAAAEKRDPRLKASLEKIALGLAIDGLGYQPGDARSPIVSEIETTLERLGMPVSAETIRKILREAADKHPVSKSTWWAGVKDGRFPQPLKLGARVTVWRVEDIRVLIQNRA